MYKEKRKTLKLEETICGKTFWTVWGMAKQLPGKKKGSTTSFDMMLIYIKEGCPCFEHAGRVFFDKDMTAFLEWLTKRRAHQAVAYQNKKAAIWKV